MNCGDIGPLLSAYYDGEVTAVEREFIENCLATSIEAQEQLDSYRRITGEFQAIPRPTPPADLRRSVMSRVHQMSGSLPAARDTREATRRYSEANRSATGSVRRPGTAIGAFGQGLRFSVLAGSLIALGIVLALVFNQINKNNSGQNVAVTGPELTATTIALNLETKTPTPQPSNTFPPLATPTSVTSLEQVTITPLPQETPTAPLVSIQNTPTVAAPPVATATPAPPHATATKQEAPTATSGIVIASTKEPPTVLVPADTATSVPPTDTPLPSSTPTDTPTLPTSTPTSTAMPPTSTPTETPLPLATAVPTIDDNCAFNPIRGFGKVYHENPVVPQILGCAIDNEQAITGTLLVFQRGLMIWDSNSRQIYVLYTRGNKLEQYYENWEQEEGEPTPAATPPIGELYIPARGFGKVWYKHQMWNSLGFATTPNEEPIAEAIQHFATGRMLWTEKRLIYVITGTPTPNADHDAVQFSGTWQQYTDTFDDSGAVPSATPYNGQKPNGIEASPAPNDVKKN